VRGFRLFEEAAEFIAQARLGKMRERLGPLLVPSVTSVAVPATIHAGILRRLVCMTRACISA